MTEAVETVEVVDEVTPDPIEVEAMEQGWLPKDQWVEAGKNPDEHRSAKEFKERGELFKTIHQNKRELQKTQQALTALQRHHQFVFEKAHTQALADLKREKRQAMKDEDLSRVAELDDAIEERQEQFAQERKELVPAITQPQVPPEFAEWVGRNDWYEKDDDLREFADATGIVYAGKNPGGPPSTVLKHVEDKVRKQFPEKFGVRRSAPNAVASVDKTNRKVAAKDTFELTEEETATMNEFIRMGAPLTKEQYISDLKKIKGVK